MVAWGLGRLRDLGSACLDVRSWEEGGSRLVDREGGRARKGGMVDRGGSLVVGRGIRMDRGGREVACLVDLLVASREGHECRGGRGGLGGLGGHEGLEEEGLEDHEGPLEASLVDHEVAHPCYRVPSGRHRALENPHLEIDALPLEVVEETDALALAHLLPLGRRDHTPSGRPYREDRDSMGVAVGEDSTSLGDLWDLDPLDAEGAHAHALSRGHSIARHTCSLEVADGLEVEEAAILHPDLMAAHNTGDTCPTAGTCRTVGTADGACRTGCMAAFDSRDLGDAMTIEDGHHSRMAEEEWGKARLLLQLLLEAILPA